MGIGQYQHDVDQTLLREKLDNTIEACVNSVGVNLNTASPYLLAYVAGIGKTLAESIVDYRSENGAFKSRESLKKVPKLGEKTLGSVPDSCASEGPKTRWTAVQCILSPTILWTRWLAIWAWK